MTSTPPPPLDGPRHCVAARPQVQMAASWQQTFGLSLPPSQGGGGGGGGLVIEVSYTNGVVPS